MAIFWISENNVANWQSLVRNVGTHRTTMEKHVKAILKGDCEGAITGALMGGLPGAMIGAPLGSTWEGFWSMF